MCRASVVHDYDLFIFFFFNDTAPTEIYTVSLHDALPIRVHSRTPCETTSPAALRRRLAHREPRSEEHTSELQSRRDLVCRLLLEKKKKKIKKKINKKTKQQKLNKNKKKKQK